MTIMSGGAVGGGAQGDEEEVGQGVGDVEVAVEGVDPAGSEFGRNSTNGIDDKFDE